MDNLYQGNDEEAAQRRRNKNPQTEDPEELAALQSHEFEIHCILQQAMNNGRRRVYTQAPADGGAGVGEDESSSSSAADGGNGHQQAKSSSSPMPPHMLYYSHEPPFVLNVKLVDRPSVGASITLSQTPLDPVPFSPTLATIDMVKRKLIQDSFAVSQLNLYAPNGLIRPFQIGRIQSTTGDFLPFDFSETVTSAGLQSGSSVFVKVNNDHYLPAGVVTTTVEQISEGKDGEIRERINRIMHGRMSG